MKKFFKEFKEFISRGNVVDLSVAVIIGAAFSAIVTALTDKIIMPLVNWVIALCGGKNGLESAYTILSKGYDADGNFSLANSIYIDWGALIAAILNFFIIAFVIFLIIKAINASKNALAKMEKSLKAEIKGGAKEKKEVKVQAKKDGVKFSVAWKAHLEAKKKEAEEKAKKLEEETKAKAEAERKANPTEQDLLKEIRDLLKEKESK